MWSTVAVNTKDKYSISGQCRDRFPCYPMFDNSRATEMNFFFNFQPFFSSRKIQIDKIEVMFSKS